MTDVKGLKERLDDMRDFLSEAASEDSTMLAGSVSREHAADLRAALAYIADLEARNADLEAKLAALEAERRCIVSHATGGRTDGEGLSLNAVSVEVTRFRNDLLSEQSRSSEARLAVAREALKAVTDDLHSELIARYGDDHAHYPSIRRKFKADMEVVNNARTALNTIGEDHG